MAGLPSSVPADWWVAYQQQTQCQCSSHSSLTACCLAAPACMQRAEGAGVLALQPQHHRERAD